MPNVVSQAIVWDNTRARPFADSLAQVYNTAKSLIAQWNAQQVSLVIPNDSTVIADGAATDGRPQVTNAQITAMVTRAQELVNWLERDTLDASGTNNSAVLNTVLAVAVNTAGKY